MTVEDYNAQIYENQQAIAAYQQEIAELEKKIEELQAMQKKLGSLGETLQSAAQSASRSVESIPNLFGGVRGGFFSGLVQAIKGNQYQNANTGLSDARDRAQRKIAEMSAQIERNWAAIHNCNAQITNLESGRSAEIARRQAEAEG